jgi:hypothetical protein
VRAKLLGRTLRADKKLSISHRIAKLFFIVSITRGNTVAIGRANDQHELIGRSFVRRASYLSVIRKKLKIELGRWGETPQEERTRNANQLKDTTMRKFHILATAAALLVTASAPSFAASRTHHHVAADRGANADTDRGYNAYGAAPGAQGWGGAAYTRQSLPYADRPYGDPDSW